MNILWMQLFIQPINCNTIYSNADSLNTTANTILINLLAFNSASLLQSDWVSIAAEHFPNSIQFYWLLSRLGTYFWNQLIENRTHAHIYRLIPATPLPDNTGESTSFATSSTTNILFTQYIWRAASKSLK